MLKKFAKNERGEAIINGLYAMFILIIIFFIGIDIFAYSTTAWKLRNVCSETLTIMKMENGWDSGTRQIFDNYLLNQKIDPAKVAVTATQKNPAIIQRGDPLTLRAVTPYEVRSLRPFNRAITIDIKVELTGLAQEFVRR